MCLKLLKLLFLVAVRKIECLIRNDIIGHRGIGNVPVGLNFTFSFQLDKGLAQYSQCAPPWCWDNVRASGGGL